MERRQKRSSGLVPITVAFACAVLLSLGAVPRSPKEHPAIEPFARELQQVLEEGRERHVGRPSLLTTAQPGDLAAAHAKVVARLQAMGEGAVPGWNRTLRRVESTQKPWSDARIAAFRAGARGVVEALVEADAIAFPPSRDLRRNSLLASGDLACADLRNLAEVECMLRLLEGRADEAVPVWLAAVRFLCDGDEPRWLQSIPFADEDLAAMTPSARVRLAAGLARVDDELTRGDDPRSLVANFTLPLCNGSYRLWDWDAREIAWSWQFGFDPAQRHLAGMKELFAVLPKADDDATGEQREAEWKAVPVDQGTWMSSAVHEWAHDRELARRRVLTRFRLLRLAIAFHAREELPVPVDPWNGEPFEVAIDGDTATLRAREEFERREWVAVRR